MMTRKQFVAIAAAVRESPDKNALIDRLCAVFSAENPDFNADRFRAACKED